MLEERRNDHPAKPSGPAATFGNRRKAMPLTPVLAAALSGASTGQLAYWRSARTSEPLLAPARHRPGSRVSYIFGDVVALRTFVYLRSRGMPPQRIRKAVASLRKLGQNEQLSEYF